MLFRMLFFQSYSLLSGMFPGIGSAAGKRLSIGLNSLAR